MSNDIVRIIRLLEYTGPRDAVEYGLQQNAVKGLATFGSISIRETTLPYPEVIGTEKEKSTTALIPTAAQALEKATQVKGIISPNCSMALEFLGLAIMTAAESGSCRILDFLVDYRIKVEFMYHVERAGYRIVEQKVGNTFNIYWD